MTKVAIKSENITSYGGIFHVMDTFSKLGLGKLIDSTLGQRGNTGKAFQYSDILFSFSIASFCREEYESAKKTGTLTLMGGCLLPAAWLPPSVFMFLKQFFTLRY
jgi:hypothetical protein